MVELFFKFIESPTVVALVAVFGVGITAVVTLKNNNKNVVTKVITEERAKWRSELRDYSCEFIKLAFEQNQKVNPSLSRLFELRAHIQLRLNPFNGHKLDTEIVSICNLILHSFNHRPNLDLTIAIEDLQLYIQLLLKQEWEKSKIEAKTGQAK